MSAPSPDAPESAWPGAIETRLSRSTLAIGWVLLSVLAALTIGAAASLVVGALNGALDGRPAWTWWIWWIGVVANVLMVGLAMRWRASQNRLAVLLASALIVNLVAGVLIYGVPTI